LTFINSATITSLKQQPISATTASDVAVQLM